MPNRHPLGNRSDILFVRMHPDENARIYHIAARHALSRCDYARMRLLQEEIPLLPPVLPPAQIAAIPKLKELLRRVVAHHNYCSGNGPINWDGQQEHGAFVYEEVLEFRNQITDILNALAPMGRGQGAHLV